MRRSNTLNGPDKPAAIFVLAPILSPMDMLSPSFALFLVTLATIGMSMANCFGV